MAAQLGQMCQQLAGRAVDTKQWDEMIRSEEMRAVLRAAARASRCPAFGGTA
jgi:hypothetical protein